MDPRFAWKAGLVLGGLGLVVSAVMMIVTEASVRAPWQTGMLGFGSVAVISAAGLWLFRRR